MFVKNKLSFKRILFKFYLKFTILNCCFFLFEVTYQEGDFSIVNSRFNMAITSALSLLQCQQICSDNRACIFQVFDETKIPFNCELYVSPASLSTAAPTQKVFIKFINGVSTVVIP